MTIEELKHAYTVVSCEICEDKEMAETCTHCQGMQTALEAINKQIPQKPLHIHKNYYCPVCQEDGWIMWDDAIPNDMDNFCGICGQKIDWEVTDE